MGSGDDMVCSRVTAGPVPDLGVPRAFARLGDIAFNLWWTWSLEARALFRRLEPDTWRRYRNPIQVLIGVGPDRWRALENHAEFRRAYASLVERFERYMAPEEPPWFAARHADLREAPIAYFSTEYGWHECLPIYSGGLGVLSGDHSKSASDLGLPLVGIGLLYKHGYFRQAIDAGGRQRHVYPDHDPKRLPILPVVDPAGRELSVAVDLADRTVRVRVWRALVGRVPVLLLDSDLDDNDPADRPITARLYVGNREMRLCQEILLGVGGVRVLDALGIAPAAWHLNEGHSAFGSLQRIGAAMQADGLSFEEALRRTASRSIFTTHTPVPAGNEVFDRGLVRRYFERWSESHGLDVERVLDLGRSHEHKGRDFNLTVLALRTTGRANGVSELHGRVAEGMWRPLLAAAGLPGIGHVTNGVHPGTWIGPEIRDLLRRHGVADVDAPELDGRFVEAVEAIADAQLWEAHLAQKRRLVALVRERAVARLGRYGRSPDELRRVDELLDPAALTIAFARRFATYKRADLLTRDGEWLRGLLTAADRPVQVVFSGKAHPADRPGRDLIEKITGLASIPELSSRLVFVEDYDMLVARRLVQGADVWLNTPRRPHEASGTSGMKAAVNGVLNCSILDGWWCEGYDASHGWVIGRVENGADEAARDAEDLASLQRVLADEVLPAFFERNPSGLPAGWIRRMKCALASLTPRFGAARMLREYADRYYVPAQRGEPEPVG